MVSVKTLEFGMPLRFVYECIAVAAINTLLHSKARCTRQRVNKMGFRPFMKEIMHQLNTKIISIYLLYMHLIG